MMISEHLKTFLWLRFRLRRNQLRKGGIANQVLLILYLIMVGSSAIGLFIGGLFTGYLGFAAAPLSVRMFIWDGIILAFLFAWLLGLLIEIQRNDPLSLDKFLHLPASPFGIFLVNYLSSLFGATLVVFVSGCLGLLLGQTLAFGPLQLFAIPLFLSFVFAVTALTYQLQGWLALLMSNPRRRRTVVVCFTLGFVLIAQIPNLINLSGLGKLDKLANPPQPAPAMVEARPAPTPAEVVPPVEPPPPTVSGPKLSPNKEAWLEEIYGTAYWMNAALPPGWLPLGAAELTANRIWACMLGTLGYTAVGAWALSRAYQSTLKYFSGQAGNGEKTKPTGHPPVFDPNAKPTLLEWRLKWCSEHVSAIATGAFRSLLRAPESKMMLLVPIILIVIMIGVGFAVPFSPPGWLRPLICCGGAAFVLFGNLQYTGNFFGYDRAGFRAYVLSPVSRRDVLLGKNLGMAPMCLFVGLLLALVLGCIYPMRPDHYVYVVLQTLSLYLLYCLMVNVLSILAPMPIAAGGIQPSNVKFLPVLWQFVFLLVFSIVAPLLQLPLGIQVLIEYWTGIEGLPIAMVLSIGVLFGCIAFYRWLIRWEGELLLNREKDLLQVVVSKVE